ncbi:MAG: hypothetical protein P9L91_06050, partial [Candidatus Zophobacter franzmannii]|nr:hypothetical protein [Candidatus Zophobacter franzmannii]
MKQIPLVHFINWETVPDEQIDAYFSELKDMGVDNIVIHPYWWMRDEEKGTFLGVVHKQMHSIGIGGTSCHGLWGNDYDMNCPDEERRRQVISTHGRFMNSAADMGCFTYTIHLGER